MINNSARFITRLLHKCEVLITRGRYHFDISGETIRKLLFKSGRRKKLDESGVSNLPTNFSLKKRGLCFVYN